jgi:hypothetical protein
MARTVTPYVGGERMKPVIKKKKVKKATKPAKAAFIDPRKGLAFTSERNLKGVDLKNAPMLLCCATGSLRQKRIIFAGLIGWILASRDYKFSRHNIRIELAKCIKELERKHKNPELVGALAEASLNLIYRRVGGMAGLLEEIRASENISKKRKLATRQIPYIVAIAHIWDFHVRVLRGQKKYGFPNLEDAARICHEMVTLQSGKPAKPPKGDQIRNVHWAEHRAAIAYLFAADCIVLDDGKTFLDLMLSNKLTYKKAKDKLSEWFGYAGYFSAEVLSKSKVQNIPDLGLSTMASIKPPAKTLSEAQVATIKKSFGEQKPSERRAV